MGWIDEQLARITMLAPDGRTFQRMQSIAASVLSRGKVRDAWCAADTVWFTVEKLSRTQAAEVRDSLAVIRAVFGTGVLDTIAVLPGTKRIQRSREALRFSLRVPFTAPPTVVPADGRIAAIGRATDSVLFLGRSPRQSVAFRRASSSATISSAMQKQLRDSIRLWFEDDMETQRHAPELRRELRLILDEALSTIRFPASRPLVKAAVALPDTSGKWAVLESAPPGVTQECISLLAQDGRIQRDVCVAVRGGSTVIAFTAVKDGYWVLMSNDDEHWLRLVARPRP
jgi:hypothetical protein